MGVCLLPEWFVVHCIFKDKDLFLSYNNTRECKANQCRTMQICAAPNKNVDPPIHTNCVLREHNKAPIPYFDHFESQKLYIKEMSESNLKSASALINWSWRINKPAIAHVFLKARTLTIHVAQDLSLKLSGWSLFIFVCADLQFPSLSWGAEPSTLAIASWARIQIWYVMPTLLVAKTFTARTVPVSLPHCCKDCFR